MNDPGMNTVQVMPDTRLSKTYSKMGAARSKKGGRPKKT